MSLTAGDKLGPYEIISLIGKGGMGEVYSAHDPRTGRDVAIKVSKEQFNERFDREVRAVASLNHPNICTLFDVGPNYLVMELVEGEVATRPLAAGYRDELRPPDRGGIGRSPRERSGASRPETRQHQDQARRNRQSAGLRAGQDGRDRQRPSRKTRRPSAWRRRRLA